MIDECESQTLQDVKMVDENEGQAVDLPELDKSPSMAGPIASEVSVPTGEHAQSVLGGNNAVMPSQSLGESHDRESLTSDPGFRYEVNQRDPPHVEVFFLPHTSEGLSKANISQHACPSASVNKSSACKSTTGSITRASINASNISKVVEEGSGSSSILPRARSTRGVVGSKK